jgi:hypothetical protein
LLVLTPTPNRLILALLVSAVIPLALPSCLTAQDAGDTPLGDVARTFRKKPAPSEVVIDNDNLSKVVDDAESRRAAGSSLVFSLDPAGKNFRTPKLYAAAPRIPPRMGPTIGTQKTLGPLVNPLFLKPATAVKSRGPKSRAGLMA